jgi:hypothetical protein
VRDTIKIKWTVSDGYCNANAPHYTEIDVSELEHCDTEDEMIQVVDEHVYEDFKERVAYHLELEDDRGRSLLERVRNAKS